MSFYRVGLAFSKAGHEKLIEQCKAAEMGQTPLIESLLFALSPDEVRKLAAKGEALRNEAMTEAKKLRKAARAVVADMDEKQLKALLRGKA